MAESILRLKVSSEEYDNKLKQATNGLTRYIDGCRKVGGALEVVEKDTLDYVRAIGQMDTTSRTATGKLAEMKKAFVELSAQYKQMTNAEKNSPMGKALAASLDELKPRIIDTKNQLDEINDSLKGMSSNAGGSGLFGEGGLSGMLQVFGGNLMTKAAGYVASLGSEVVTVMNESAALAREAEGVQIAFARLGDGSLLDGLRQATHGTVSDFELMKSAVKFNDFKLPVEELGTMLAFAQQKAKDTGQSVDYMVDSIVTGLGRKSLPILDNLGLSATEIRERMKETGDMTKAVAQIIEERMSAAGGYVETASDRAAQATVELENAMTSLGETFAPLVGASDSLWNSIKIGAINALNTAVRPLIQALAEAGALGQGARSTAGFNNLGGNSKIDRMIGRLGNGKSSGAYSIYKQQLSEFDRYINNKQFQIASFGNDNSGIAQSAKTRLKTELDGALRMREEYIRRAQELHNKVVSPQDGGGSGSSSGGGKIGGGKGFDIASIAFSAMSDSSMKYDPSQHAQASGLRPENILGPSDEWENYKDVITDSIGGISDAMNNLSFDNFQESYEKVGDDVEKLIKSSKASQQAMTLAASAANSLGSAFGNMEDPGAKAAGMVVSAIASIALGFAQAAAAKDTVASGWAWLVWVAAGLAAMATSIATVHNLTGFAEGGIVGGNSYSGDNIYGGGAMVNSGELVLNKAQQGNLASQLQGNGINGMNISGRIKGTDIILSVDRSLQLQGKQLLTWG